MIWEIWKKNFAVWEGASAKLLEGMLKSPLVLEPTGAIVSALVKARGLRQRLQYAALDQLGVATKRDQERTLHLLHELESRLYDVQEKLDAKNIKQDGG